MSDGLGWETVTILCSACSALSAVAGSALKTMGDRLKIAHEDRKADRDRHVSEKEMWEKLGCLEQKVEQLTVELVSARTEAADLRTKVAVLAKENQLLRERLDEIREGQVDGKSVAK